MNRRLGEILIDKGYLSEEQVMRALEIQLEESKEGMWVYIGEILIKQGIVNEEQVEEGLAVLKNYKTEEIQEDKEDQE